MNDEIKHALIARLTALADDELILAHRNSEWTGHAPILEEDIALANIAQDELGHATVLYGLVEELTGTSPDQLAFFRDADAFRNVQLLELPKGDWAFTMLRQYLFDTYEHVLWNWVLETSYQPLVDVVTKFRGEELYHLRHSHIWVERLGLGTDESNQRMQSTLNMLWPYTAQLFTPMTADEILVIHDLFVDVEALREPWSDMVLPHIENSGLALPVLPPNHAKRDEHTSYLTELLNDMQEVARWDPEAKW
ncbi:MAG: 1,2-phenylacetyl-CoA epoxidase subunit PaaC [Chloroflexota bacterium]